MGDLKKPYVTPELLQWLKRVFPDRCPDPRQTDREIWMAVGAAGVVRKLEQLHEEQSKNALLKE